MSAAAAAPDVEQSPSSPRLPTQRRSRLFQEPEDPSPSPSPSPSPLGETSPSAGAESPSGPDALSESTEDESPAETSLPASSADVALGKKAAQRTARQAVLIAGGMAHTYAARTELQKRVGLYLADEEDAENIGDPLGSLVARRGGVAGKAVSPDTADLLSAIMGLARYMSKQIALTVQLRGQDAPPAPDEPVDL